MVNTTLFLANVVILVVMAAAFAMAFWTQQRDRYLATWTVSNLVLGVALILFTVAPALPPLVTAAGAHTLLILGFGLRWRAMREFNGRPAPMRAVAIPAVLYLVIGTVPAIMGMAGFVYGLVNLALVATLGAICVEILSPRREQLPSRFGLFAVYLMLAGSFTIRAVQGAVEPTDVQFLRHDDLLTFHLVISLIHTTGSGAFALAMAFERQAAALRLAAMTDWLTGLANRRAFDLMLTEAMSPEAPGSALIVFDVDHFKAVNDRLGHAMGDNVLALVARAAQDCLRKDDMIARTGGEEFGVLVPYVTLDQARAVAERIRAAVQASWPEAGVTISLGVHHFSAGSDGDAVMREADSALYRAKRNGRNRVEWATSGRPTPRPIEANAGGARVLPPPLPQARSA